MSEQDILRVRKAKLIEKRDELKKRLQSSDYFYDTVEQKIALLDAIIGGEYA